jgi:hypothetical protein
MPCRGGFFLCFPHSYFFINYKLDDIRLIRGEHSKNILGARYQKPLYPGSLELYPESGQRGILEMLGLNFNLK